MLRPFAAFLLHGWGTAYAAPLELYSDLGGDTGLGFDDPELVDDVDDVVGGEAAALGRWPDAAGIVFRGAYVGCTGTLVAPKVVLTAGHCVGDISHVMLNTPNWLLDGGGELIEVVEQIENPKGADIAVLLLAEPATTPYRIIARDCIVDEYLRKTSDVWVVGYGATRSSGRGQTSILHEGLTTVQTPDCSEPFIGDIWTGCLPQLAPGGEMGAGGDGVDACFGDSGGPLYLPTDEGTYLIGVTSRAYAGVPESAPCKFGGIYIRPDAVMRWIEKVAGEKMPYPPCNDEPVAEVAEAVVARGASVEIQVEATDDDSPGMLFRIAEAPEHGAAEIDADGVITYTADGAWVGSDPFVVEVEDQGLEQYPDAPKNLISLTVDLEVTSCGCASGPGGAPGAWWLTGPLVLLGLRRRR